MRTPRSLQYDHRSPPFLHVISRCVRRAFLCGDGCEHRRQWIEQRLELLAGCFAVDVAGYAVMTNHLHVVVRPVPDRIQTWSDEQVARAWLRACAPMGRDGCIREPTDLRIEAAIDQTEKLATWRKRLGSLSWLMKALKEPISRLANVEDDCTGTFWEGRFQSVPLLDQAAIVSCLAYVDLNPVRANLADSPESSEHTSIAKRIRARQAERVAQQTQDPHKHRQLREISRQAQWLVSIATATAGPNGHGGIPQDDYFCLVDVTGRAMRRGKRGRIPRELPAILQRLDIDSATWVRSMERPRSLLGVALGSTEALAREALRRGRHWLQRRCALLNGPASV